jgi:hypothetical protein
MKRQAAVEVLKSKVIINNDMEKFGKDLVDESRRIFKIYLGNIPSIFYLFIIKNRTL